VGYGCGRRQARQACPLGPEDLCNAGGYGVRSQTQSKGLGMSTTVNVKTSDVLRDAKKYLATESDADLAVIYELRGVAATISSFVCCAIDIAVLCSPDSEFEEYDKKRMGLHRAIRSSIGSYSFVTDRICKGPRLLDRIKHMLGIETLIPKKLYTYSDGIERRAIKQIVRHIWIDHMISFYESKGD
jgi:hypothetical protein